MLKHWMEIVHNHDNGYFDWLFHKNILPPRESTSIRFGNGKGVALEELFRSPFTEIGSLFSFQFN